MGELTTSKASPPPRPKTDGGGINISQRLVILLSHERSGSHLLADLLRSTNQLISMDEVCNFDAVDPDKSKASYFRFRHDYQLKNPNVAYRPSPDSLIELLDAYFSHVLLAAKSGKVLVDIKYGHVHNFEVGWWPSENMPFLLKYLRKRNVRIVHLTRRDSVAAAVSGFLSNKRRVWHRKAGDPEPAFEKVVIPAQQIVRDALALEREKDNYFGWLSYSRYFNLAYEDIGSGKVGRKESIQKLCRYLELSADPTNLSSSHEKVLPPLKDVVDNFTELRQTAIQFGQGRLMRPAP